MTEDAIESRMTEKDRADIRNLYGKSESARWELKRLRARIRARIVYEMSKEIPSGQA